jgi:hypothetical protein
VPQAVHAALPRQPGIPARQAQREEVVLAVLLRPGHARARSIAERLPASAFGDPYRRAVFETIAAMHEAGRPVDALTVDWELATAGLPLYDRPGVGSDGTPTFAARLARAAVTDDQALRAVSGLQAEQAQGSGLRVVPDPASAGTRRQRRGRGELRPVSPPGPEGTRPLRLVQRPPGRSTDGPDRRPQQGR